MGKVKILRLEIQEALKHAIQVEMDLTRFYEAAVNRAATARMRELLERILAEEQKHRLYYEKTYEELTGHRILYLNVDPRRRLAEVVPVVEETQDLLEQALRNEEKAAAFYGEAARLVPPGWVRAKFEEMAEVEREHQALLRSGTAESVGTERTSEEKPRAAAHAA
ncbi:MAG: ferritin family protein [candidate division KSB1 bacterium]|nr:ferritin family protein [candidate division KSB1 bacterium]